MIPTRIGQKSNGGTFTGFNRIVNHVYAIVVAPKSTEVILQLKNSNTATPGTQSLVDGHSNTNAMDGATHPAAFYCKNLNVSGYIGWYLPSKNELELCYRYLKPTTEFNCVYLRDTYNGNLSYANGTKPSSIPIGMPYTKTSPAQTVVTPHIYDNGEEVKGWYWSSTEFVSNKPTSVNQYFLGGLQSWSINANAYMIRSVRRELIACLQE